MFDSVVASADQLVVNFSALWPENTFFSFAFNIRGMLAVLCVCLICGAMGALVVGNRMAFFSDALAHCAFAGVALGVVISILMRTDESLFRTRITEVMVGFGVAVGLMIAFVRERTGLASDTVIGVFYAGAIGLGAVFTRMVSGRSNWSIENFIFGNPVLAPMGEVLCLGVLALGVVLFLWVRYNQLLLTSASPSLARSRRVPVRLCHYLLIVLLGLMVNLSLQIVGALLINGLLIVPAAAAANLARNLRQMFWYSIGLATLSGVGGYLMSWEVSCHYRAGIGTSGAIVVLAVLLFMLSMPIGQRLRERIRPTELAEKEQA